MAGSRRQKSPTPGFVVRKEVETGAWQLRGAVPPKRGLPARAARSQAILDVTSGAARKGEVYAAVLRSEWRVAMDWSLPGD